MASVTRFHPLPNLYPDPCRLCHRPVAPEEGFAVRTGKGRRVVCAACLADPEGAAGRGGRIGWVFALLHPRDPGSAFIGCSRFPALRCAQILVDLAFEARRRGEEMLVGCDGWAIEVPDRFAARSAMRAALKGQGGEGGTHRVGLDAALSAALSAARDVGIEGTPVPIHPTDEEWNRSGQ